jgi:hypothetical protein
MIDCIEGFIVSNQVSLYIMITTKISSFMSGCCAACTGLFLEVFLSLFVYYTYIGFLINDSEDFIIRIYLKYICGCAVFSTVRIS